MVWIKPNVTIAMLVLFCMHLAINGEKINSLYRLHEAMDPSSTSHGLETIIPLTVGDYHCDVYSSPGDEDKCYYFSVNKPEYNDYRGSDLDMLELQLHDGGLSLTLHCENSWGGGVDDEGVCILDAQSVRRHLKVFDQNDGDEGEGSVTIVAISFLNGFRQFWDGGSIYIESSSVQVAIVSCKFQSSFASRFGGAIYVKNALSFAIYGSHFSENTVDETISAMPGGADIMVENELSKKNMGIGTYTHGCGHGFFGGVADSSSPINLSNGVDSLVGVSYVDCLPCSRITSGFSGGAAAEECEICDIHEFPR